MVTTATKRVWLRRQWALVPNTHANLLASLQAAAFSSIDGIKNGSIASVSQGDTATSFSNSDHGQTQSDFAELGGEILDLYDASRAALVTSGIGAPTDSQIFTEMLDRLQPVTSVQMTYTTLRTAP